MRRLPTEDRRRYFGAAVQMLSWGFPDTWSKDVGHQVKAWTKCEKCLSHVGHLVKAAKKYNIEVADAQRYGELLLRCSW